MHVNSKIKSDSKCSAQNKVLVFTLTHSVTDRTTDTANYNMHYRTKSTYTALYVYTVVPIAEVRTAAMSVVLMTKLKFMVNSVARCSQQI